MNVNWLIEQDAFDEGSSAGIIDVLKSQDINCKIFKSYDYFEENYSQFEPQDCVFFYGSVQVASAIQQKNIWNPGVIGNFEKYKSSYFLSSLGEKVFNSECVFIPFGVLKESWKMCQRCFGSDALFLRPDGGDKDFPGQVVEDSDVFFEKEYVYLSQFVKPESMCLVSNAFNIDCEYRLVISNGKVVAGSQYRKNNRSLRDKNVPGDVIAFTENNLNGFAPDNIFILDVCQSNGNYYYLEANMISCAGLYAIDPHTFVQEINKSIKSNWKNG